MRVMRKLEFLEAWGVIIFVWSCHGLCNRWLSTKDGVNKNWLPEGLFLSEWWKTKSASGGVLWHFDNP